MIKSQAKLMCFLLERAVSSVRLVCNYGALFGHDVVLVQLSHCLCEHRRAVNVIIRRTKQTKVN